MAVHEIKDKVCFITGGANGLGALMVKAFLDEGAKHVAFLDVAQDAGIAFEKELTEKYGVTKAKFIKCDITKEEELVEAYNSVSKDNGYIDVVINNAGIMNDSKNAYKKEIELNVTALITSSLKAIELMRKDHGGRGGEIINVSSIVALFQSPYLPIYFATKSAVLQFSNCIGMEHHHSRTGVRVLAVCFGVTDTSLFDRAKYAAFDAETDVEIVNAFKPIYFQKIMRIPINIGFFLSRASCAAIEQHAGRGPGGETPYQAFPLCQRPESAVSGFVEAFKRGESGSTWLAANDQPVVDITSNVKEAFTILSRGVFP